MAAKLLPRDPIAAELMKARWLLARLGEFCGAAHFELPTHDHARAWSPGMYRLHGIPAAEPVPDVHAYCERFVAPEDRAGVRRAFETALHHPGTEADVEFAIVRPDGSRRLVRALTQSFALDHGAVELLGVIEDLTARELRQIEPLATGGRLAALTRFAVVGEMAAGLAHEMNQPLTALTNYANVASRLAVASAPGDTKLQRALDGVAEETSRASEIVRRIRSFVRLPLSEVVPVDVDALVHETVPLVAPLARRHAVSLAVHTHGGLPTVHADPVAIQLALVNLLSNAIEASGASGRPNLSVEISTSPVERGVEIRIADRGIGLEPGAERQLFMPFYTTKPDAPGLGLSIARSIVAQHAGSLALETNPSGGVTARVNIPAPVSPAPKAAP